MIETADSRWNIAADHFARKEHQPAPPTYLWAAVFGISDPHTEPQGFAETPTAIVHINAGRWLALCPFCTSRQYAAVGDKFYCAACNNRDAGYRVIPQAWPLNSDDIAKALDLRPAQEFKHWNPGETVADLRRQDLGAMANGTAYAHLYA